MSASTSSISTSMSLLDALTFFSLHFFSFLLLFSVLSLCFLLSTQLLPFRVFSYVVFVCSLCLLVHSFYLTFNIYFLSISFLSFDFFNILMYFIYSQSFQFTNYLPFFLIRCLCITFGILFYYLFTASIFFLFRNLLLA